MGFKVIFAPLAIERLKEIVCYIARDNPLAAETFGFHLIDRTDVLAEFPKLGQPYRKRQCPSSMVQTLLYLLPRAARQKGGRSPGTIDLLATSDFARPPADPSQGPAGGEIRRPGTLGQ